MKNQMLTLVIGILIGAIISTGVFLVLKENNGNPGNMRERPVMDENMERDFEKMRENREDKSNTNISNIENPGSTQTEN